MSAPVDPLTSWPVVPPIGYSGQLTGTFQARRAESYRSVRLADCTWYHTTELPDGRVVPGEWDLRQRESDYIGGIPLAGRSVLELGPASGHMTFWMEGQGAEVTALEVGYDARIWMVPPADGTAVDSAERSLIEHTKRTTNAWWLVHRERRSAARMVHGDIYRMPDDLGDHDIVTLGCVLVHVRDPFQALQHAASHARQTVIVTEQVDPGLAADDSLMRFNPDLANPGPSVMWWHLSPGAVVTMLWRLGFADTRVHYHHQRHRAPWAPESSLDELPMFTVVANRSTATAPSDVYPPRSQPLESGDVALREAQAELQRLRNTRTWRWSAPLRQGYGTLRRRRRQSDDP